MLRKAFKHVANSQNPQVRQGAIFEFGVASGTTFAWLAQAMQEHGMPGHLIGFDSFKGLPKEAGHVWAPAWHGEGEHAFGREHVEKRIVDLNLRHPERIQLIEGFFGDTLTSAQRLELKLNFLGEGKLSLVNIDVDLYISTMQLLQFVHPLLQVGTMLYFDDWKDPRYDEECKEQWGEHRAWAEWSEANPSVKHRTVEVGVMNNRYIEIIGL